MNKIIPALFLLLLSFTSCQVTRERCNQLYPPVIHISTDSIITVTETLYDTTVIIQPDSGYLSAIFECDSANEVLLKELTNINGERLKLNLKLKRNNKTLTTLFSCNVDSMGVYVAFKSRDTSIAVTQHETKIQFVEREKKFNKKEMFVLSVGPWCIGFCGLLLLAIIIYICWKVFSVATPQGAAISAGGGLLKMAAKLFRGGAVILALVSLCSFTSATKFKKGQWVYWIEVNQSGQRVVAVGKILGKDFSKPVYRVLTDSGWCMHYPASHLTLVKVKQ